MVKIIAISLGLIASIHLFQYFTKYNHPYLKIYGLIVSFTLFNTIMTMSLFYIFANLYPRFQSRAALKIEMIYCLITSIIIIVISYLYLLLFRILIEYQNPNRYKNMFLVILGLFSIFIIFVSIYSINIQKIRPISYLSIGFIIAGNIFNIAVLMLLNIKSKILANPGKRKALKKFTVLIIVPYSLAGGMFISHILFDISNEVQNIFRFSFHLALYGSPIFLLKWFMKSYHGEIESTYPARKTHLNKLLIKYKISKREWEIIQLICEGKSNKEIEEDLFIALQTVKDHVFNIYQKTGVKNRVQLNNLFRFTEKELFPVNRKDNSNN